MGEELELDGFRTGGGSGDGVVLLAAEILS
jgi:hypothetical protein